MLSPTDLREVFAANGLTSDDNDRDPFKRFWSITHPDNDKITLVGQIVDPRPSATESKANIFTMFGTSNYSLSSDDPINIAMGIDQINDRQLLGAIVHQVKKSFLDIKF